MVSRLTPQDIANYHEDGLIFVRGLFDAEETDLLRRAMEEDPAIAYARELGVIAMMTQVLRAIYPGAFQKMIPIQRSLGGLANFLEGRQQIVLFLQHLVGPG